MKYLIILLFVISTAHAESPSTQASAVYTVPYGTTKLGVVEWIPKDNKDVRCVFTGLAGIYSGTACYTIKKEQPIYPGR